MLLSFSCSLLRKLTLGYILLWAVFMVAQAEEFGISRRTTTQSPQEPSSYVLPYIVRIIAFDHTGQSFGTGSYVGTYGEYGVILTNSHVVSETEGLVHVHFPSGFSSFGAIIKRDPYWDLALIAISKPPPSIPMLTVSQTPPKPGDPLWIAGFGSGTYRIAAGRCVRYIALEHPKDGTPPLNEIVEVSVSARKGDSGGPILNQKEELAGVLFGSDMIRNTAGSYCERVNLFLMDTRPKMDGLPSRPETYFASIEKNGPLRSLRESRNGAPQNTAPQYSDFSGSSGSSFGVRSSSRRYVPPTSQEPPQVPPQTPQRGQGSATMGMPLSALTPLHGIQSAAWAEASPKIGQSFPSAKVVQTAHLMPLKAKSPTAVVFPASPSTNRYLVKLASDRNDLCFTLFLSTNICLAIGLSYLAVRLLRTDGRKRL